MAFQIAVTSGKGGTGKTTFAVALALALPDAQLLDCDVEAPNARLFLGLPEQDLRSRRVTTRVPVVDPSLCDLCEGRPAPVCREVCAFGALAVAGGRVLSFPELCHACGACVLLCPRTAFREEERRIGTVTEGRCGALPFVEGRLAVGELRSVDVIRAVKERARAHGTVVIDGPPGTACPMVETLRGVDAALLVTEPTPFGRHDLEAALTVCRELDVPAGVILNRADIGDSGTEALLRDCGVPLVLRVPHDRAIAEATAAGRPLTEVRPELVPELRGVAKDLREITTGARA